MNNIWFLEAHGAWSTSENLVDRNQHLEQLKKKRSVFCSFVMKVDINCGIGMIWYEFGTHVIVTDIVWICSQVLRMGYVYLWTLQDNSCRIQATEKGQTIQSKAGTLTHLHGNSKFPTFHCQWNLFLFKQTVWAWMLTARKVDAARIILNSRTMQFPSCLNSPVPLQRKLFFTVVRLHEYSGNHPSSQPPSIGDPCCPKTPGW